MAKKTWPFLAMSTALILAVLGAVIENGGTIVLLFAISLAFMLACWHWATDARSAWLGKVLLVVSAAPVFVLAALHGPGMATAIRNVMGTPGPDVRVVPADGAREPSPGASMTPNAETTRTSTSQPEEPVVVTIKDPEAGVRVGLQGVVVRGEVRGMSEGESLWLFVKSPDDGGRHFLTEEVVPVDGLWSLGTGQLGSKDRSEVGKLFQIEVVLLRTGGRDRLMADLRSDGADRYFQGKNLPKGYEVLATRVIERS